VAYLLVGMTVPAILLAALLLLERYEDAVLQPAPLRIPPVPVPRPPLVPASHPVADIAAAMASTS